MDCKVDIVLVSYAKKLEALKRAERLAATELSEDSSSTKTAGDTDERAIDGSPGPTAPKQPEQSNREGRERINLTGRVGIEPRFRTTKNDTLVCTFPLAVHTEDGSTKWHDLVAFKERALKLQGSLHKGEEIEIVGHPHTKQVPGKDGKPKEKREIWAAVVRKPKSGLSEYRRLLFRALLSKQRDSMFISLAPSTAPLTSS
jgi:hypothetical protein